MTQPEGVAGPDAQDLRIAALEDLVAALRIERDEAVKEVARLRAVIAAMGAAK